MIFLLRIERFVPVDGNFHRWRSDWFRRDQLEPGAAKFLLTLLPMKPKNALLHISLSNVSNNNRRKPWILPVSAKSVHVHYGFHCVIKCRKNMATQLSSIGMNNFLNMHWPAARVVLFTLLCISSCPFKRPSNRHFCLHLFCFVSLHFIRPITFVVMHCMFHKFSLKIHYSAKNYCWFPKQFLLLARISFIRCKPLVLLINSTFSLGLHGIVCHECNMHHNSYDWRKSVYKCQITAKLKIYLAKRIPKKHMIRVFVCTHDSYWSIFSLSLSRLFCFLFM